MLPQQKLVVISLIWSVCIGILIIFYVYKKKQNVNYLVLLLLISLVPLISLLRPGSYESGDLSLNVYKTMALYQSLQDGVFPANWAGVLNATYGYPLFNFTYPLPYYVSAFFHFLGFSFLDSVKLFIAVTFVLSGVAMYFFLKSFLPSFFAFVGGIFYLFAPYHLVDMHFRVDIGEIAAIAFIPLLFLFSGQLLKKYNPYTLVFLSLSFCGLILSHQAVSLTILPFVGIYVLLLFFAHHHQPKDLLPLVFSTILGFSLAAFYIVPVLFELQYTQQSLSPVITFEPFREFFYSPWRYGLLFQGHQGELSFVIGYIQWLLIGIGVYFLWKGKAKKDLKYLLFFSLFSFFALFFMMQEASEPLWYTIPLIKNFQFSYRLLAGALFFSSLTAAIVCFYLDRRLTYVVLFLVVFSTILNWGNRRNMPELTDSYFIQNLPYSTFQGEGLTPAAPKWVDSHAPWFQNPPKRHLEIIKGTGTIKDTERITNRHVYAVSATSPLTLVENTVFFPGWTLFINNRPVQFTISESPQKKGLMSLTVPKGTHKIQFLYEPTPVRKIGMLISLAGLLTCIPLIVIGHKKYSLLNQG